MSKIIVVGGGPSGMMAALNASKSNHIANGRRCRLMNSGG